MSDIDTAVVDSLKALDPKRPIREADIAGVRRCSLLGVMHTSLKMQPFKFISEIQLAALSDFAISKSIRPILELNFAKLTLRVLAAVVQDQKCDLVLARYSLNPHMQFLKRAGALGTEVRGCHISGAVVASHTA